MRKHPEQYSYGFERKTGSKIHIKSLEFQDLENHFSLAYQINVDKKDSVLWFKFPSLRNSDISYEVIDGVVVMLLSYALRGGYHIVSEIPMTRRLWFQLSEQVIPQLCAADKTLWKTIISAPLIDTDYHPTHVATAMSCGVDSFTTFFSHSKDCVIDRFQVDTLTFFQNGAHHSGVIGHSDREPDLYKRQCSKVRLYCDQHHYPLIEVSSNIDEFLSNSFWRDPYLYTHTYRNIGFALMLQKYISVYYYSGIRDIEDLSVSLWDDSEAYDKWLLPLLSTGCTCFYSITNSMDRVQKTAYISNYEETYNHLLVCFLSDRNCGQCIKCKRTLLILDLLDELDDYSTCFDLEKYYANRNSLYAELCLKRFTDPHLSEVYKYARQNGFRFSIPVRIEEIKTLARKVYSMLNRSGKV